MNEHEIHDETQQPQGGGGALFTRPDNLRSDARMAARIISLGVVPTEQAEGLLRQGFLLAAKAAQHGDIRNYVACMKLLLAGARLEQIERLKDDIGIPLPGVNIENAQIVFNVPDNGRGPERFTYDPEDNATSNGQQ